MVARRRPAVRKRRMRDRPPGADQLVPDLSGKPEVGVAVVVDVPDLGTSFLGISVPVAGDADPTRTVLISLLEDSIPAQDLALYLRQRFIVHPILPSRDLHCALTSCYGIETRTSGGWTVYGLNLRTVFAAANLIRSAPGARSISHLRYVDLLQCFSCLPTITSYVLRAVSRKRWLLTFKGVPLSITACKARSASS